jgi:hypothetical protein
MLRYILFVFFLQGYNILSAQHENVRVIEVDSGWSSNSVNTVVFRKNSLVTFKDTQYIAFYNGERFVVAGKRKTGDTDWQLVQAPYSGNAADAHNSISMMADGDGYLHVAWDHHGNKLNYTRSIAPGSLELTGKLPMTGFNEQHVTYPEFYKLSNGNILFFYRDGSSGKGNLVVNRYDVKKKQWKQLHSNLIDGEGKRNAYWQACVDERGVIHLSWVWRESPDVSSNHDMCYAKSVDGGITWMTSAGKKYTLPITASSAEYACMIPQKSELINQTSMCADASGNPFIATYYTPRGDSVPQYHIIHKSNGKWKTTNLGFRKTAFSLSGAGTKRIPISRPQIVAWKQGKLQAVGIIFRDAERGNKVSVAISSDVTKVKWNIIDLFNEPTGSWEPTYDTEFWKEKGVLNLFVQRTEQADAEGSINIPLQLIKVLEWKPY